MEWTDEAIVLGAQRHGDSHAVLSVLSREHGRHTGFVRGTRRLAGALQPGNSVRVTWRGRLADHLGSYSVEPVSDRAGAAMQDALTLAALSSACAVASGALPEREAHTPVYESFRVLLDALGDSDVWPALYVRWELGLLQDLGFGLDLSRCAATGGLDDLTHVSPRTGRAVSAEAAAPWVGRLFPLPAFLLGRQAGEVTRADILAGLNMSGYFLERRIFAPHDRALPPARVRLAELLSAA